GAFELLNFANKTNVTINGLDGADVLNMAVSALSPDTATLFLNGLGHDDVFNVSSSPTVAITVDGGVGVANVLNVNGQTLDHTIPAAAFTADGRLPLNF